MIVRKGCESSVDARAAMMVAKRLLRTPTPPAASVLRPTGSVPEVKLVPPTKLAEDRITAVVVKSKLHILACDQPWGYDAIASSNAGDTDQATYTVPRTLDANVAAAWANSFRTVSASAGTPVDAIVHDDRFVVTTLPAFTGPDVHVYSVDGVIVDTNAETGTAVGVGGVTMDVVQAEVTTPRRPPSAAPSKRGPSVRRSSDGAAPSRPRRSPPLVRGHHPDPCCHPRPRLARSRRWCACDCVRVHHAATCTIRRPHPHDCARERDRRALAQIAHSTSDHLDFDRSADVQRRSAGPARWHPERAPAVGAGGCPSPNVRCDRWRASPGCWRGGCR